MKYIKRIFENDKDSLKISIKKDLKIVESTYIFVENKLKNYFKDVCTINRTVSYLLDKDGGEICTENASKLFELFKKEDVDHWTDEIIEYNDDLHTSYIVTYIHLDNLDDSNKWVLDVLRKDFNRDGREPNVIIIWDGSTFSREETTIKIITDMSDIFGNLNNLFKKLNK
tara:strand:- start:78242 stop:78751 length:510 start_codon:yes stop_codon:yes gene_type:complete